MMKREKNTKKNLIKLRNINKFEMNIFSRSSSGLELSVCWR